MDEEAERLAAEKAAAGAEAERLAAEKAEQERIAAEKAAAEKALLRVNGVEAVTIDLESGEAKIVGSVQENDLKNALEAIGFGME